MQLTKLQEIEAEIMHLETERNPRSSSYMYNERNRKLKELKEERKKIINKERYGFE